MEMKKVCCGHGLVLIVVVLGMLVAYHQSEAQEDSSSSSWCMNQLAPCLNYLINGDRDDEPPSSCCDPLKSVIKSKPECLCSMVMSNKGGSSAAGQAGINITEAQQLPGRCGQNVNPFGCLIQSSPNNKNNMPNGANSLASVDMLLISVVALSSILQISSFMGIKIVF